MDRSLRPGRARGDWAAGTVGLLSFADGGARPWFLWDTDLDEPTFRLRLAHPDPRIRAQWQGALLREARFREVFEYMTLTEIVRDFANIERHLGRKRAFWRWILEGFRSDGVIPAA